MRVIFVYPNVGLPLRINHGIASLSAILKKHGHHTGLIQYNTKKSIRDISKISRFGPDIVAISTCTNQWHYAKILAKEIKRIRGVKIFAGGAHPTVYPECLLETEDLDGICLGEGEEAFLELVTAISKAHPIERIPNFWIRRDSELVKNELRPLTENIDELPVPDWEIFGRQTIENYPCFKFSRGCVYNCAYCINYTLRSLYRGKGPFIRIMSARRAIEEIKDKLSKYDIKFLYFDDDGFLKNSAWIEEFSDLYGKEIGLPFNFNSRAEDITPKICKTLKRAGAQMIGIGIESGDPGIRKALLGRPMTDEEILYAFRVARENGLKTFSFNMIGIPGETPELFKKTIQINRKAAPDMVQLSVFYPYPGTPLGDLCRKNGFITEGVHGGYFDTSILNLKEFPPKEIHKWYDLFEYLIYKDRNFLYAAKSLLLKLARRKRIAGSIILNLSSARRRYDASKLTI